MSKILSLIIAVKIGRSQVTRHYQLLHINIALVTLNWTILQIIVNQISAMHWGMRTINIPKKITLALMNEKMRAIRIPKQMNLALMNIEMKPQSLKP